MLFSQDALPLNNALIETLVRNFADQKVAGAFARHVGRPEHGPAICHAVQQWSGSLQRHEAALAHPDQLSELSPLQRAAFCRFDNVCSAIRRTVWQQHPFAPRPFAEDLDWSRRVLLSGWKIVYEPTAAVEHSHTMGIWESYRRCFQTHQALTDLFDLRLISHRRELLPAFLKEVRERRQLARSTPRPVSQKFRETWEIPLFSAATVLGTYNGSRTPNRAKPL